VVDVATGDRVKVGVAVGDTDVTGDVLVLVVVNVGVAVAAGDWFVWPWLRAVAVSAVATRAVRVWAAAVFVGLQISGYGSQLNPGSTHPG